MKNKVKLNKKYLNINYLLDNFLIDISVFILIKLNKILKNNLFKAEKLKFYRKTLFNSNKKYRINILHKLNFSICINFKQLILIIIGLFLNYQNSNNTIYSKYLVRNYYQISNGSRTKSWKDYH